jgi:hypothetical protein
MNTLLASLYGTGQEKVASEEATEEIDLSQISAADFIVGLEEGSITLPDDEDVPEKTASDESEGDLDLSTLSGAELLQILDALEEQPEEEKTASESDEELDLSQISGTDLMQILSALEEDEQEKTSEAVLEKMAEDGDLQKWDMAGRVMAHSFHQEMQKMAETAEPEMPDDIEVNLDEITGEQLVALMESGYEFDEADKTASAAGEAASEVAESALKRWFKAPQRTYAKSMKDQLRNWDNPGKGKASKLKALGKAIDDNRRQAGIAGALGTTAVAAPVVGGVALSRKKKD